MSRSRVEVSEGFRLGAYTLVVQLGRGGFAPVWLAKELWGNVELRNVAIKLFRLDGADEEDGWSRILEEARALCRVEHPNIVRFYSVVTTPDESLLGIVMEHLAGRSLEQSLQSEERLDLGEVLSMGAAVASALAAVHAAGLVHRDIKPANVINVSGVTKLIDFGIAQTDRKAPIAPRPKTKRVVLDDLPIDMTAASVAIEGDSSGLSTSGTIGFIDPASLHSPATPASDLYSLGAMLFQCVTGQLPAGAAARLAGKSGLQGDVLDGRAAPPSLSKLVPDANPSLVTLVDSLLDPDPTKRPRSAESVSWTLERIRREVAGHARPLPDENDGAFRGLARFEEGDRDVYFGRTAEIAAALEMLRTRGLVALVGASGSGKSSLARAGVLPAVQDNALGGWPSKWVAHVVNPGVDPFKTLQAALAMEAADADTLVDAIGRKVEADACGVVLLVDQLEELVTLSEPSSRDEMGRFLARVGSQATPGIRCLVALRRDWLDPLLAIGSLGRVLTRGAMLVSPMTAETWGEVIDQALGAYGYSLEDDELRAELLSQLGDSVDAMPLVEFALTELWKRRDPKQKVVPRSALREIGGISGALEMHAERVVADLLAKDDDILPVIYSVLMATTTAKGTRAVVSAKKLEALHSSAPAVIRALEEQRLLIREGGDLTLTHEALLSQWARLRRWIDEARADRTLAEEIEREAAAWSESKSEERVWRKGRLLAAEELAKKADVDLSESAMEFLRAGRRVARRGRLVVLAVAVAAVIAMAAGAAKYWNDTTVIRAKAISEEHEARLALRNSLAANAQGMALAGDDPSITTTLALRALVMDKEIGDKSPAAQIALSRATLAAPSPLSRARLEHLNWISVGKFSPDGTRVLTASDDRRARLWDATTGEPIATHESKLPFFDAAFSADGKHIALATAEDIELWDFAAKDARSIAIGDGAVTCLQFSPDGQRMLVGRKDNTVDIIDVVSGAAVARIAHDNLVDKCLYSGDESTIMTTSMDRVVMFSDKDGKTIHKVEDAMLGALSFDGLRAVVSNGGWVKVFDVKKGRLTATMGAPSAVHAVAITRDGKYVAIASADKVARIWNADTGELLYALRDHTAALTHVAFSPDGSRVVTSGDDARAVVWDVHTGGMLARLEGHDGPVGQCVFSPDNRRVLTTSDDLTARIWDSYSPAVTTRLQGHWGTVNVGEYSPDDKRVVTGSDDKSVNLWNPATGALLANMDHGDVVNAVAFSPDARQVVSASSDGLLAFWDAATGVKIGATNFLGPVYSARYAPDGSFVLTTSTHTAFIVDPHTREIVRELGKDQTVASAAPALSRDGKLAATVGADYTFSIWEVASGALVSKSQAHSGTVGALAFSPDGTRIASSGGDVGSFISDVRTGKVLLTLPSHGSVWSVDFSPDGTRLVTGGADGAARIWDMSSGKLLTEYHGHKASIAQVSFSPDGTRVLSAADDKSARVWDASTSSTLAILGGHTAKVRSAVFSHDGKHALTTSEDHTARLWDVTFEGQLRFACIAADVAHTPELKDLCSPSITDVTHLSPLW